MKIADTNPDRPLEEILKDIELQATYGMGGKPGDAFAVFGPLAGLLVNLSRLAAQTADKAAKTADKTLAFTKYLFWATIILLAVTILLVVLEIMKFNEPGHSDSKTDKTQQQNPIEIKKLPPPITQQPTPSPGPGNGIQKEQDKTANNARRPSEDQAGPEKSPSLVKVIPATAAEPQTAKTPNKEHDYASPEWWMVYVSIALVAVTTGLAIYTAKLWGATKALAEDARLTADRQARETKESLRISKESADAARESADIAKTALTLTQRAFVVPKVVDVGINITDHRIKEYIFLVRWENVGSTPATDVRTWIYFQQIPMNEDREPLFAKQDVSASIVLGPRSAPIETGLTIPLPTIEECWRDETKIFIWARVEYRDIFDDSVIHHHEQCARVQVIHDPRDIPPQGHRPYAMLMTYGPQNSSS